MANNSANVLAGKPLATGGVLVAPTGTAAPVDAMTALNASFKALGYVGEDGLTESAERSTDKIKAWGGDVVKVVQTDYAVTYSFTLIETLNSDVLKAVHGAGNVTTTAATSTKGTLHAVKLNGDTLPRQSFVFEVKDGDARIRIYVPQGQITEVGEVTYSDEDVIGYEVTVEAFRDATAGANAIKYIDDGVFSS
ncbi:hypothetical protein [Streptomyces lasalocidi]|uniref:Phage tail protein n=1 Tax=Streptomyces lasalocidi TaxID=324833 RepID=A0A4U5WMM6_STRLS|nr:hypothetical protein [Streptomyces lasalocidi]TKT03444.1 hypothetical protein E4U91_27355 [Streptomyces lasalocidi]